LTNAEGLAAKNRAMNITFNHASEIFFCD